MQPPVDRFGLPLNWSLVAETSTERAKRTRKVIQLLVEVYGATVRQLGEPHAKAAWLLVSRKKPGRPKGLKKDPDLDRWLLEFYDAEARHIDETRRRSLPRQIALFLQKNYPRNFPVTVQAIEKRIRRLLRARTVSL
jgi:hypothetical protein